MRVWVKGNSEKKSNNNEKKRYRRNLRVRDYKN